ncbi:hypothetical protein [Roseobacter sp. N2S]|uniref:hypothetical protein n=1 Tax=Roseobacter sp. N2S TaxID=2663844 RepID=UPI00286019E1|nr:hypothetical protein [Roseobacter sp. N2S]MDR6266563.1 hypothetical protein [Roseobacter sp. N2S]
MSHLQTIEPPRQPRPITDQTLAVIGRIGETLANGQDLNTATTAVLRIWLLPVVTELQAVRNRQDQQLHHLTVTAEQMGVGPEMAKVIQLFAPDQD